jgi:hypothetical protein
MTSSGLGMPPDQKARDTVNLAANFASKHKLLGLAPLGWSEAKRISGVPANRVPIQPKSHVSFPSESLHGQESAQKERLQWIPILGQYK